MVGRGNFRCPATLVGLAAGVLSALAPCQAQREDDVDRGPDLKAAYLYNFGLYTVWPAKAWESTRDYFVIGVLGSDALVPLLNQVYATKTLQGKKILVKHFANPAKYTPCQILFITEEPGPGRKDTAEERLSAVLKRAQEGHVLLVGESEGMVLKGAMLSFFIEDNRMKFEVNPARAHEAGLQLSSKLLRIGKIVENPDR
jgi:hypothetical protein